MNKKDITVRITKINMYIKQWPIDNNFFLLSTILGKSERPSLCYSEFMYSNFVT